MSYFNNLSDKIKKLNLDRKTKIIIVIGFSLIFLLLISEMDFSQEENMDEYKELSDEEYCLYLEEKIKEFVENIDGAGKTKVIITLAETTEYIYATDNKDVKKNNSNSDDSTLEKDYVIIENNNNDEGLLIKTIEPKVRGIAISCEGGNNAEVQQQIYSAIEAILDINTSNISISKLTTLEEKNEK